MKYKSAMTTSASGSVDGMTASRNRFGRYMRARAVPVNPSTGYQQTVRSLFTDAVNRWISTLTAAQRNAWNLYGSNVPTTGPLGDPANLTGQNWFIACNTARRQPIDKLSVSASALPYVDSGPTVYDRGDFTDVSGVTADEVTGLAYTIDDTDDWANEDEAVMLVSMSRMQNPTRNFYRNPWRLIAAVLGNSSTPPATGQVVTAANVAALGYTIVGDMHLWLKVAVSRADGRLSSPRFYGPFLTMT